MVKLLRLTTDNNGKFNADLDAGIEMSENAQIAVQNLTFETTYDVLSVHGDNQLLETNWNAGVTTVQYGRLQPKDYTSANIATLSIDLEGALNETLGVDTLNSSASAQDNYSEFKLSEDTNTTLSNIQYKLCPLSLPFHLNIDAELRTDVKGDRLWGVSDVVSNVSGNLIPSLAIGNTQVAGDGGINLGNLQQVFAGNNPTADLSHFCYPIKDEGQLSYGSGVLFCNVSNVLDNSGDSNTNGFGMGLSFTPLDQATGNGNSNISSDMRDFEVRINRPQDTYTFHNNLVAGTSAVRPHVYSTAQDANNAKHDLMMIERADDKIIGSICNLNSYSNLPQGNPWTQTPTPATENFDTTDLGEVATYRRVQVGGGAIHWWEAVDATNWNIYLTKPVIGQTPDSTATIVVATGVITIGGTTFTPSGSAPGVIGGTTGLKRVIFQHRLTYAQRTQPLYPYMYFCGGFGTAIAGHPAFTPHCLTEENLDFKITGADQILTTATPPAGGDVNAFELYSGTNSVYTDILQNVLRDEQFIDDDYSKNQDMQIEINNEILRSIGFTVGRNNADTFTFSNTSNPRTGIRITNENEAGYDLIAQNENTLSNSDNYVLMIDSNPVKSYDASKFNYDKGSTQNIKQSNRGRQLNILATIPVNDSTNGIVEYDANELVYIDLDNKFPQVLKNIRLRILDKNFNEISTIGTSILTLLIKDE